MENMLVAEAWYREHQARVAWVDANFWQFARPARRHPMRQTVAQALLALAAALAPVAEPETQTA